MRKPGNGSIILLLKRCDLLQQKTATEWKNKRLFLGMKKGVTQSLKRRNVFLQFWENYNGVDFQLFSGTEFSFLHRNMSCQIYDQTMSHRKTTHPMTSRRADGESEPDAKERA